jgi:hypothetical protein
MHVDRFSLFLSISIAALVAGCGGGSSQSVQPVQPDTAKTAAKPTAESPASEDGAAGEQDAEAEEGDKPAASFATLRAGVLACPTDEDGEIDTDCEGYTQWNDAEATFEGGKANPDLVRMLGSKDAKERRLGAEKLRGTLDENLDVKTADAVLDAAEKERNEKCIGALADLAGGLDLVKVGKLDRAIAISKAHPVPEYAEKFVFFVGTANRDPKLVAYAVEVKKAESASMRNAALQLLSDLAGDYPADTCKVINDLRADKDKFVANRALSELARRGKCVAFVDKLLDSLSTVDVKKDVNQNVGYALDYLCVRKDLTPAQRERANKAARRISEATAVHSNTRYYTLSAVMRCDPANGAAFVSKFKTDKNATLAGRAAELTKSP